MAIYYQIGEETKEIYPKNEKFFTYEELKALVQGMVEIMPLPDGRSMVVNEEGKLIGLPENPPATALWKEQYPIDEYPYNYDELVVGDVLVVTEKELEQ